MTDELEGIVGYEITATGTLGVTSCIVRLTTMPRLSYWDSETFGYNLRWVIGGSERIDCAQATKVDGHYVLFFGTSVFGVADDREEANQRLRGKLEDEVGYVNGNFTHRRTHRYEIKDESGGCAPVPKAVDEAFPESRGVERMKPVRLRKRMPKGLPIY